jgi:hypothetical protein
MVLVAQPLPSLSCLPRSTAPGSRSPDAVLRHPRVTDRLARWRRERARRIANVRSSSLTVHEVMEGVVDRVSRLRRPAPAVSPAVEQFPDVVEVPAEDLLEGRDGVTAHIEHLR